MCHMLSGLQTFALPFCSMVPFLRIIDPLLLALCVPYEVWSLMEIVVGRLLLQVTATLGVKCFEAHCTTRYTAYWRNRLFDADIAANWTFLMRTRADNQEVGRASCRERGCQ